MCSYLEFKFILLMGAIFLERFKKIIQIVILSYHWWVMQVKPMTSSDVLSCYEQELAQADDLQRRIPHKMYHPFYVLPQRRQHNYTAEVLSHTLPLHCWQLAVYVNCGFMRGKNLNYAERHKYLNIRQPPMFP